MQVPAMEYSNMKLIKIAATFQVKNKKAWNIESLPQAQRAAIGTLGHHNGARLV